MRVKNCMTHFLLLCLSLASLHILNSPSLAWADDTEDANTPPPEQLPPAADIPPEDVAPPPPAKAHKTHKAAKPKASEDDDGDNPKKDSDHEKKEGKNKKNPEPKEDEENSGDNGKNDGDGEEQSPLMVMDYEYKADPQKAFKMQIPSDWDAKENYLGYELFLEPKEKMVADEKTPIAADPNISVKVLNKPLFIDDVGLEDYAKEIQEKFVEANGAGSEFQIFQKVLQDLDQNRKAFLYDATYKKNDVDAFQTILVVSSETQMYRLTLTDYKAFFDKNRERYFPILASVQIAGQPPVRPLAFMAYLPWILGIVLVLAALFLIKFLRNRSQNQWMSSYESGGNSSGTSQPPSSFSGLGGSSGPSSVANSLPNSIANSTPNSIANSTPNSIADSTPLAVAEVRKPTPPPPPPPPAGGAKKPSTDEKKDDQKPVPESSFPPFTDPAKK